MRGFREGGRRAARAAAMCHPCTGDWLDWQRLEAAVETVALLVQPEQRWVLSAWEPIDHVGDPGPLGFWDGLVKRLRMHGGWLLLDPACMPCWENLREIVVKPFVYFIHFFFLNSSPWEVTIFFNLFSFFIEKFSVCPNQSSFFPQAVTSLLPLHTQELS